MLSRLLEKIAPDSKFTKVWSNSKYRSGILLLFWFVFIMLVYLIFVMPFNSGDNYNKQNNNTTENVTVNSFEDMKYNLLNYNFDFKLSFTENNATIIYKGTSTDQNNAVVYKQSVNEIKEYYLENNIIYSVNVDDLTEENSIERHKYLDLNNIFNLIIVDNAVMEDNQYVFETDNIYAKINVEEDNISSIEIKENENTYLFEFSNIGKIEEITY